MKTWHGKLLEVFEDQRKDEKAIHVDNFDFQADSVDGARAAAKEWLERRGIIGGTSGNSLRACSFLANEENTLAIVIQKPRPKL